MQTPPVARRRCIQKHGFADRQHSEVLMRPPDNAPPQRRQAAAGPTRHPSPPTALPPPSVGELEHALTELVDELFQQRQRRRPQEALFELPTREVLIIRELQATSPEVLHECNIIAAPVDGAFKNQIREIGVALGRRLTLRELRTLVGRVAGATSIDPDGQRYAFLEVMLDGVTCRNDGVWLA
jgi:hypothetical protein